MIILDVIAAARSPLRELSRFPESFRQFIEERVRFWAYDNLPDPSALSGALLFCGCDRVDRTGPIWLADQARQSGRRVFNDPCLTCCRLEQLERFHQTGLNIFNAAPVTEHLTLKPPIFLRDAGPDGSRRTNIISTQAGYIIEIDRLRSSGVSLEDLIAVEWASDRLNGIYSKFGAYIVGSKVIPGHAYLSSDWWVRGRTRFRGAAADLFQDDYIERRCRLHLSDLHAASSICNVDFGRIDYSVINGKVSVYEINYDPTIISPNSDCRWAGSIGERVIRTMISEFCQDGRDR